MEQEPKLEIIAQEGEKIEKKVQVMPMPPIRTDLIKLTEMGTEDCPIDKDAEELNFYSHNYRIGEITGLEECTKATFCTFRNNLIKKIVGLENMTNLEELEFYDNKISKIENISHMTNLKYLFAIFIS